MIRPVGKRVLVKGVEMTAGSLIIASQKPLQFRVESLGDEATKVKVGDVIYMTKYAGVEIEHLSDKYLVVEESEIVAVVE